MEPLRTILEIENAVLQHLNESILITDPDIRPSGGLHAGDIVDSESEFVIVNVLGKKPLCYSDGSIWGVVKFEVHYLYMDRVQELLSTIDLVMDSALIGGLTFGQHRKTFFERQNKVIIVGHSSYSYTSPATK